MKKPLATGRRHPVPNLAGYIDSIPFVDTHSHVAGFEWGTPLDDRQGKSLPQILMNDYLLYLVSACTREPLTKPDGTAWTVAEAAEQFARIQPHLDRCRGLTLYRVLREGIRELHPFRETDITAGNWQKINRRVILAYREHGERAWHRQACARVGIVRQTQICFLPYVIDHWGSLPAAERDQQRRLLLPSLVLDGLAFTGFVANQKARQRSQEIAGVSVDTHAGYLDFCRRTLDLFQQRGGVSVKLLAGYRRPLRTEDVDDREAARLYERGPDKLDPPGLARLQDNLLRHLWQMVRERQLPLIVHTGYTVPPAWGDPEHLYGLFTDPRFQGIKVDVCHSGWPNLGGALIMARTYRDCYFNLCGTSSFSDEQGTGFLAQAIEALPLNKILLGTDCGSVEAMVGTARLIRRQLANVLAGKVAAGQLDLDTTRRIARALLRDNAVEFYSLKNVPESLP